MNWHFFKPIDFRIAGVLAAVLTLCAAPAWAAQMVVLEAFDADGFEVGSVIESTQAIELPADAELVLIGEDGSKVSITGPFSGIIADKVGGAGAAKGDMVAKLASALTRGREDAGTDKVAAMRGLTMEPEDFWAIDLARAGAHCVPSDRRPVLWKGEEGAGIEWLAPAGSKKRAKLGWEPETATADWPGDMKVKSGAGYVAGGGGKTVKITLHLLPGGLDTVADQAAWMVGQGCDVQAVRLLIDADADHEISDE